MAKSDGSVIIDTRMDTGGFEKGMSETKGKINSLSNAVSKLGSSIKNAFGGNFTGNTNKGVENYEAQIKKLEAQLDRLIEKQIRFVETGGNRKSRTFAGMEYDIEMVRNKLEELRLKQEQVSQTANTQPARTQFTVLKEVIARVGKAAGNAFLNVIKLAGKGILNGVKKLGNSIKKMASSMLSFGKNTKGAHGSMLKMLGTSILFSSIFRVISGLINGFKEGIKNLVRYSDEANNSMSSLKSAMTQLKNSLATAFMPLITIVTPALVSFINTLSKALTIVGAFFSALSGKGTYTKAVEVQEDYAEGLKDTSKNAKDAKKSLNQYFSSLDEIRTFTAEQNKDEEKTDGQTAISPTDMFTEESIPTSITDFANKIKEIVENLKNYFKNQDWAGLGEYLADGVNSALQFLYDVLNWENVKEKIVPFIQGFTTTFNSFVDNIDWDLLGRTIGTGINTLINILYELITGIDWKNLGIKFGEGINGLFSEIDWAKAGETLGEAVKGLLDLIIGFLEETDWQQIGKAVADFIGGIDWGGIVSRLFEGLGAALGGLAAFLMGLIEDAWNSVVEWWNEVAFEDGKFTMQGLLEGILEVFKNIGTWIVENILNPFINGFKEAFGIHSPSTVMAEIGNFIMQGLINGVKELFGDFEQIFENIKNTVINVFTTVKNKVISIWEEIIGGIKKAINGIIKVINGMISGITDGINGMINALNALKFDVPDWVPLIGGQTFGLNIGNVSAPQIPYLATGAVIPPNAPFMAVLGDQKRGTNIEAPLDTIKQAIREEVGSGNGNGNVLHNVVQINRRTLFEEFIEEAKLQMSMTGHNPLDLRT